MHWARRRPSVQLSTKLFFCDFYSSLIYVARDQKHNQNRAPLLAAAIPAAGWLKKEWGKYCFMVKSRRGKKQTEWNEMKRQQGETAECYKSCVPLHSRAKLMHWLPVISEFCCHLAFQCSASNLNVLWILLRGCSNLSTAWHEDNQSRRLCSCESIELFKDSSHGVLRWK